MIFTYEDNMGVNYWAFRIFPRDPANRAVAAPPSTQLAESPIFEGSGWLNITILG